MSSPLPFRLAVELLEARNTISNVDREEVCPPSGQILPAQMVAVQRRPPRN